MRIVKEIEIDGHRLKALFDTGSVRSYLRSEFRPPNVLRTAPVVVGLGGRSHRLDERCDFTARIEGLDFEMTAYLVPELAETEHGRSDVIVGALTMEEWWIKLDPHTGELDLAGLRRREFTEY